MRSHYRCWSSFRQLPRNRFLLINDLEVQLGGALIRSSDDKSPAWGAAASKSKTDTQTTVISSTSSCIPLTYLLVRKSAAERAVLCRRHRRSDRRRRMKPFYQLQARQRTMFYFVLSATFACASFTTDRSVWTKERSTHWWDYIVNDTFTASDWLAIFRMSRATFVDLRDQLRHSLH